MTTEQVFQLIAHNLNGQLSQTMTAVVGGAADTLGILQRDFNKAFSVWRATGDLQPLKALIPVLRTYNVLNDVEYDKVNEALEEN